MTNKKKVLVIADSPLVPSGVGTQTRYMIESLLKTEEYKFFCLAGALKHRDYRIQKVQPWNEDWLIKPVDGYGSKEMVRAIVKDYKPDILWFMTDPRFYVWLWEIENEIRKNVPMVYYHVWDNYPYPDFNKKYYDSNDTVCTISKVTDDIVRTLSPEVNCVRIPHTVDTNIFMNTGRTEEINNFRKTILGPNHEDKLLFFWNNRNARRKQSGTLMFWFKEFLDNYAPGKAALLMHTDPYDHNGQNLQKIIKKINTKEKEILFSTAKLTPSDLAAIYNACDCTINISDAEGFGLSTLESLACETPIIVNMTGGLQEQVTDGEKWFGIGIEPCSKAIIGSQNVPYIYEDRIAKQDFLQALQNFVNMSVDERNNLGSLGRAHVINNYGFDQYHNLWKETLDNIIKTNGSWENRKNYKSWTMEELP